jgi:hypothetical protein
MATAGSDGWPRAASAGCLGQASPQALVGQSPLPVRIPHLVFTLLTQAHTENHTSDRDLQERPRYGMKSAISRLHRCSRTRLVEPGAYTIAVTDDQGDAASVQIMVEPDR